jgi:hypothetical protein
MSNQTISEHCFRDEWGAKASETGDLFTFDEVKDTDKHRVWTVVEGEDDSWYALPGYHVVNKLGYVLTDKPWSTGLEEAVWFQQDTLPYGIAFAGEPGEATTITSDLEAALSGGSDHSNAKVAADVFESLLLALYSAGAIKKDDPSLREAISTAVDAIANNLD